MTAETTAMVTRTVEDKKAYRNQILAALAVSLGALAGGMGKGYSSPAIASLQANTTNSSSPWARLVGQDFTVDDQQASWIASLSLIGAVIGASTGGLFLRFGRQRTLLYVSVPFAMSWLLTTFATTVELLYVTSLSAGFFTAIVAMVTQIYISETSVSVSRGGHSSLTKIFNQMGVLLSYLIGYACPWRVHAFVIAFAPVMLLISAFKLPETPSYLMLRGREAEAAESLQWFRGPAVDIRGEMASIRATAREINNSKLDRSMLKKSIRSMRVPLMIACGVMFFQRFTGAYAFHYYAVSTFEKSLRVMDPHIGAISMCLVEILALCLSGMLIDSVGRKPLLKWSGALMSTALFGFGCYNYLMQHAAWKATLATGAYDWVPLMCVLVFTVAFSLGVSPIPVLLTSELFTMEHRGLGISLVSCFSYLCGFANVKTFIDFQQWFDLHGTFWLYACVAICIVPYVNWCVPETKGMNMDELEPRKLKKLESVLIVR